MPRATSARITSAKAITRARSASSASSSRRQDTRTCRPRARRPPRRASRRRPTWSTCPSAETYIGYRRADGFRSPGGFADDRPKSYTLPASLELNEWGLLGRWTDDPEKAVLDAAPGKIEFRFLARDLHLVLGPAGDKPVRFRVRLDGLAPGANHGVDTDAEGNGVIREQRLYQLIRQSSPVVAAHFLHRVPGRRRASLFIHIRLRTS